MESPINQLQEAHKKIEKGERIKVFYESLMQECGLTYSNTLREVMESIKKNMTEYYDAIGMLSGTIEKGAKKLTKKR